MEVRQKAYMEACQAVTENVFSQYIYKTLPTCNHLWVFKKSLCLQMALSGEGRGGGKGGEGVIRGGGDEGRGGGRGGGMMRGGGDEGRGGREGLEGNGEMGREKKLR